MRNWSHALLLLGAFAHVVHLVAASVGKCPRYVCTVTAFDGVYVADSSVNFYVLTIEGQFQKPPKCRPVGQLDGADIWSLSVTSQVST
jgi:hypothetical protein